MGLLGGGLFRGELFGGASQRDDSLPRGGYSLLSPDDPGSPESGVLDPRTLSRWIGLFVALGLFARVMR